MNVVINNGKEYREHILADSMNGTLQITDSVFAKYAVVNIYYQENNYPVKKAYFIKGIGNQIDILLDTSTQKISFQPTSAVIDQDSVGRMELTKLVQPEKDSLVHYSNEPEKIPPFFSAYRAKMLLFISQHPDLYLSLITFRDGILSSGPMDGVSMDSLQHFYIKYLHPRYINTYEDTSIQQALDYAMLTIGKKLPTFLYKDVNDKTVDLQQLNSKYVLLNFWASWCGPCVKEIPILNEIRKQYPSDFLEFAFVTLDESKDVEKKASLQHKNTYGIHFMSNQEMLRKCNYGGAIPITYIINRETGELLLIAKGSNNVHDIEEKLRKLYGVLLSKYTFCIFAS
ncbi:MAG: TlpA disulfide reductase family protein [Chitinophagaceae bacterium]